MDKPPQRTKHKILLGIYLVPFVLLVIFGLFFLGCWVSTPDPINPESYSFINIFCLASRGIVVFSLIGGVFGLIFLLITGGAYIALIIFLFLKILKHWKIIRDLKDSKKRIRMGTNPS